MFALTRPSLLKSTDPKLFFGENLRKMFVSLGTTTSCIGPLKSQGFASPVPFNVIEMVPFNVIKMVPFNVIEMVPFNVIEMV